MTNLYFTVGHATFHLVPVEDRFEWRTTDGTCRIGSNLTGRLTSYWAKCGDLLVGREYRTLGRAMRAASNFQELLAGSKTLSGPRPSSNEAGLVFDRVAA